MIYFQKKLITEIPLVSDQYEEGLEDISDTMGLWLGESGYSETETGLYLGTLNAGIYESIAFWQNALIHSPRFANPANFSWTLSNGPASLISRRLKIKGPCYTLVGGTRAIEGCLYHASGDLKAGIVSNALVSGLDIYNNKLHFCACLLSFNPLKHRFDMESVRHAGIRKKYAFSSLKSILDLLMS